MEITPRELESRAQKQRKAAGRVPGFVVHSIQCPIAATNSTRFLTMTCSLEEGEKGRMGGGRGFILHY